MYLRENVLECNQDQFDQYPKCLVSGNLTNFTINNIAEGSHTWNINCTDQAGYTTATEDRLLYIDTQPPQPYILTVDGANFSDSTPEIQFNITDNLSNTINYTFWINYSVDVNQTGIYTVLVEGGDMEDTEQRTNKRNICISISLYCSVGVECGGRMPLALIHTNMFQ